MERASPSAMSTTLSDEAQKVSQAWQEAIQKSVEILRTTNPAFSVNLLVRTPEQIRQRLAWNDFFLREILEKGTLLYAAPVAGVGR